MFCLRGRTLARAVAVIFVLGNATRVLMVQMTHDPFWMYAVLPVQLDTLAAGAALALFVERGTTAAELRRVGAACVCIGGIATSALVASSGGLAVYRDPTAWTAMPHNLALLPALATLFVGVLALAITSTPLLAPVLRMRPLVALGKISYGVYLYHAAFIEFGWVYGPRLVRVWPAIEGHEWIINIVEVLLTLVAASLSWRLIEEPILRLKDRWAPAVAHPPGSHSIDSGVTASVRRIEP